MRMLLPFLSRPIGDNHQLLEQATKPDPPSWADAGCSNRDAPPPRRVAPLPLPPGHLAGLGLSATNQLATRRRRESSARVQAISAPTRVACATLGSVLDP